MILYGKILNEKTGLCEVGTGTNIEFYKSIGYMELDVIQSDIDNNYYLIDKCPMKTEEEKAQEERERINQLFLTRSDVERAIYKVKGIDFIDLLKMVEKDHPEVDLKALKIELGANNFYRGNPYVEQVGMLLGFTSLQLDKFFETGDYKELETVEPEPSEAPKEVI